MKVGFQELLCPSLVFCKKLFCWTAAKDVVTEATAKTDKGPWLGAVGSVSVVDLAEGQYALDSERGF